MWIAFVVVVVAVSLREADILLKILLEEMLGQVL